MHSLLWKRFIDDIFCIWDGPPETLDTFYNHLNSAWPDLGFTMTYDLQRVSFLDTLVIKDNNGQLTTDLFTKSTDRNGLLHYSSNHPTHIKKSIPQSQFKRVEGIVSDPVIRQQRLQEMGSKFIARGYPQSTLQPQHTGRNGHRSDNSERIPFIHTYHPFAYTLHKIIRKHWNILSTAYPSITSFQKPFMPCFKWARNLRDSLVRADIGSTKRGHSQKFLQNPKMGTFPCLQCRQCSNVMKGSTVYHPQTGKQYAIKGYYTCESSYVVYLIKCPCGMIYIGETTQPIRDRISKHKSTIRCKNLLLPIPHHFIYNGHNISQLRFQVLEQVQQPRRGGDRIHLLKQTEAYWIHKLESLSPKGLNRDYDLLSFT
ncbi:uncharacterized protein [Phyllobates terribilis]|uniref:uncharacterized protein n=1 Tax=Phyllobates terribilis TaxID=111132 RepID=UPI003CCB3185